MQKYTLRGRTIRLGGRDEFIAELVPSDDGPWHAASDVKAALAAKDARITELEARERGLREPLEGVMMWIDGWSPNFTDDPDWLMTHEEINKVLAAQPAALEQQEENNGPL